MNDMYSSNRSSKIEKKKISLKDYNNNNRIR